VCSARPVICVSQPAPPPASVRSAWAATDFTVNENSNCVGGSPTSRNRGRQARHPARAAAIPGRQNTTVRRNRFSARSAGGGPRREPNTAAMPRPSSGDWWPYSPWPSCSFPACPAYATARPHLGVSTGRSAFRVWYLPLPMTAQALLPTSTHRRKCRLKPAGRCVQCVALGMSAAAPPTPMASANASAINLEARRVERWRSSRHVDTTASWMCPST
jgi:hypothetical protein